MIGNLLPLAIQAAKYVPALIELARAASSIVERKATRQDVDVIVGELVKLGKADPRVAVLAGIAERNAEALKRLAYEAARAGRMTAPELSSIAADTAVIIRIANNLADEAEKAADDIEKASADIVLGAAGLRS